MLGTLLRLPFPRSVCPGQTFAAELDCGVEERKEGKLPVALENIHVVDLEAPKTGFDRVEDVLTGPRVRIYWAVDPRLGNFTLRERPWRLTYPLVSGSAMNPPSRVSPTVKKTYKTEALSDRNARPRAGAAHFGQNDDIGPRDVELLEGLPEDDLGQAIGVCVSGIKGVDSVVESVCATDVSVRRSRGMASVTYANLMCSRACFSPNTQSCHSGDP